MRKVLITGGEGQLAQSFIKLNHELNCETLSLNKNQLDITDTGKFISYIEQFTPDTILNCAAMTNVNEAEKNPGLAKEINAFSIQKILPHFNGLFIEISTDFVFDGDKGGYSSTDEPNPINAYGESKYMGEQILKKNSENWIIIRAGGLFSIFTDNNFYSWVVSSLKRNEKINGVNDQLSNPVSTFDLARYIIDIQNDKSMRNKIYHIGSDAQISKYDFAMKIARASGLDSHFINPISTVELQKMNSNYIAQRPKNSSLDVSGEGDRECDLNRSIEFLKNSPAQY